MSRSFERLVGGVVKRLLCCLLLSSACVLAEVVEPIKRMPSPPFRLVQPHGELLSELPAPGKTRVWVFGFTECGHVCPMMMYNLSKLYNSLSGDHKSQLDIVFVTFDPVNDTLQKVASYVRKFSHHFAAARPEAHDISEWMNNIGLTLVQDDSAPASARFQHTPRLVVQDDRGYVRAFWPSDIDRSSMAADLKLLRQEHDGFSAWLRRIFL